MGAMIPTKVKELLANENRKKKKSKSMLYIQGLGLFQIFERSGEGNGFFCVYC
jgi:hypothetical protein